MSTLESGAGKFRLGSRFSVATRRSGTRERYLSWVLVRLTGLVLTVLVLGHFALTHIVTDVAETDAAFVERRWGSAFWLVWDWLLLAAAVSHGAAGIWIATADYVQPGPRRRLIQRVLIAISITLFSIGTITIVVAAV